MADLPTAHIVVYQAYLDTLTGLIHQRIGHQTSQGVVLDDVQIKMDMVLGTGNIFQQFRNKGIAISDNVNLIILEG